MKEKPKKVADAQHQAASAMSPQKQENKTKDKKVGTENVLIP